eukprot:2830661-Prymnesium_polylepis.1
MQPETRESLGVSSPGPGRCLLSAAALAGPRRQSGVRRLRSEASGLRVFSRLSTPPHTAPAHPTHKSQPPHARHTWLLSAPVSTAAPGTSHDRTGDCATGHART